MHFRQLISAVSHTLPIRVLRGLWEVPGRKKPRMRENLEKDIRCPRCPGVMTFQGVQSIGAGSARIYNVEVYLCPKCGCNGRYDERALKIVEIK